MGQESFRPIELLLAAIGSPPTYLTLYVLFFKAFYVSEAFMLTYSIWCIVVFDLFAFAILQLLSNHYEVVASELEHLDFKANNNGEFGKSVITHNNILKRPKTLSYELYTVL